MYYAELQSDGTCAVIRKILDKDLIKDNYIEIPTFDTSILGKVYNDKTGEFDDYVPPEYSPDVEPVPEPEYIPSNTEIYENQMIIMSALADIAEMQMGVQ